MEVIAPTLIALGLACCCGLRAWLPLLLLSALSLGGYVELNPKFAWLGQLETLYILLAATAVETIGDKFAFLDHILDAIGAVLRPAAGTVMASSLLFTHMDTRLAILLGLCVGGGAAFTVNAGKALARSWVTAMIPAHGGIGNAVVSAGEDAASLVGAGGALLAPWLAALVAIFMLGVSWWLLSIFFHQGGRFWDWLWGRAGNRSSQAIDVTKHCRFS